MTFPPTASPAAPAPPQKPSLFNGATTHGVRGQRRIRHPWELPLLWVGVAATVLGYPDQLVEVEAVAVRDSWQEPGPPHGETVTA